MKANYFKGENPPFIERSRIEREVASNVYNTFLNSFNIEGLTYQENLYFKKQLYNFGYLACAKKPHLDEIYFCSFAPIDYNIYDFPVRVTLMNKRGVSFIPPTPQMVDEDVIIGYALPNNRSIKSCFQSLINKIINCEMVIQINLILQKIPFAFKGTPESMNALRSLWDSIFNDTPALFLNELEANSIEALITGAPYLIDKLVNYREYLYNQILTILGIKNLGINEKKEHLITSEVESNNDYVEFSNVSCFSLIEDFINRINERFGTTLELVKVVDEIKEMRKQEAQNNQNNQNNQNKMEDNQND